MQRVGSILKVFSVLLFCCLLSSPATAESPSFQTGKAAFDRGDFTGAYDIFLSLTRQLPGDPETDFLLGRSAYERGDFEAAIFAFERVLISQPEADRVKLELARSQFAVGDLEAARSNFNRVLANRPPVAVQKNIERYLELLDNAAQKHRLNGSLTLGLSYDDNVYASPLDEQIETLLQGTVTLSGDSATPQDDLISQNSLQLNHLYRSHPQKVGWLSSLLLYNAFYSSAEDLNLGLFGVSTGPAWQQGKLQLNLNYITLDDEQYLTSGGISAERSWKLHDRLTIGLSGQASRLDYDADGRDANQYRLEYRQSWSTAGGSLSAALGLEENQAREDEYSYLRKSFSARYQQPLPWKVSGFVGLRFQASDYDGPIALFGKARKDRLRELALGLSRPVWSAADGNGQLVAQLLGTLNKTSSNIDLYEYDKQVVSFSLSYQF